ncbi:MAG: HalX domain-containing protein [Candidatus Heimdallarchaeaceae archaeon]
MGKTKAQILKEKKKEKRTFKENTAFGDLQDRITELESRIEEHINETNT